MSYRHAWHPHIEVRTHVFQIIVITHHPSKNSKLCRIIRPFSFWPDHSLVTALIAAPGVRMWSGQPRFVIEHLIGWEKSCELDPTSDCLRVIMWPGYWPLIGRDVEGVNGITLSDWLVVTWCWPLIGRQWSRDLGTGFWLVEGVSCAPDVMVVVEASLQGTSLRRE